MAKITKRAAATRRLTKAERTKLGLSEGSRARVAVSPGAVTKRTRLYSETEYRRARETFGAVAAPKRIDKAAAATRRLTKAERLALGLSSSNKARVSASVAKVTKRTKLYTEHQWLEAKLGKSRKENTIDKRTKTMELKHSREFSGSKHTNNITHEQLLKLLRRARSKIVILSFFGVSDKYTGGRYADNQSVWISTGRYFADEIDGDGALLEIEEEHGFDIDNRPERYGIIIYDNKA